MKSYCPECGASVGGWFYRNVEWIYGLTIFIVVVGSVIGGNIILQ